MLRVLLGNEASLKWIHQYHSICVAAPARASVTCSKGGDEMPMVTGSQFQYACQRPAQSLPENANPGGTHCRLPETLTTTLEQGKQVNSMVHYNDKLPAAEGGSSEWSSALSRALYNKEGFETVSKSVEAYPNQVRESDRHQNYPLHVACIVGASLQVMKLLFSKFPGALWKRIF